MADIFITHKCNLNCSYCFSKEHVNKCSDEISIENFIKLVDFNKTERGERLGIVGGEPSRHSKFKEIIQIIKNDDEVEHCVIFSNGIELGKFAEDFNHPKFNFLLNCNSSRDIGNARFEKMKKSIEALYNVNKQFNLGVNLYSLDLDYSFIFDLLKMTDKHELRFSFAIPNSIKEEEKDVFKCFEKAKPFLNKFFKDCFEHEVVPHNDCNAIPPCIMNDEDKKLQVHSAVLARKYDIHSNLIESTNTCNPIITIFPNMCATRSMCYPHCEKVPVENFANIDHLRKYLYKTVDIYSDMSFFKEECKTCRLRIIEKCGVCKVYKLKQAEELKKYVMNRSCAACSSRKNIFDKIFKIQAGS